MPTQPTPEQIARQKTMSLLAQEIEDVSRDVQKRFNAKAVCLVMQIQDPDKEGNCLTSGAMNGSAINCFYMLDHSLQKIIAQEPMIEVLGPMMRKAMENKTESFEVMKESDKPFFTPRTSSKEASDGK